MIKSTSSTLSLVLVSMMLFVTTASAATYGIMGGMVVYGTAIGNTPVVVQFDGRELFLSEADCKAALEKVLIASAVKGEANTSGVFPATSKWSVANPVTKINLATCVKTSQF